MNVVLEPQANCIVNLQIEVPADRVASERLVVTKGIQRQARVPGFRPGKAPLSLIESRYAEEIRSELIEKLISASLKEAIKEKNLSVLEVTDVQDTVLEDDNTLRFKAVVVTSPDFELPDYSSLTIEVAKREPTDLDVTTWLEHLREPHASYEAVEGRPLAMDDFAVVSYEGTLDGQPLSEALPKINAQLHGRKNSWVLMSESTLVPGFAKAIEGMAIGETKAFTLDVPAEFPVEDLQGRQVSYEVTLHGINVKSLPPFDDALAEKIQPGKTLEALREDIRTKLREIAENQFRQACQNAVHQQLVAKVSCDLPQGSVDSEMKGILNDIVRENQIRGVSDEELRSKEGQIIDFARESAQDQVRASFILLRIAEKEKIEVSQTDLIMAVSHMAQKYQVPVKKLMADLKKNGAFATIRDQILTRKALELVTSRANIVAPAAQPAA